MPRVVQDFNYSMYRLLDVPPGLVLIELLGRGKPGGGNSNYQNLQPAACFWPMRAPC